MSSPATEIVVVIVCGVMFTGFMIALWLILRPLNKLILDVKKLELQFREFGQQKTSALYCEHGIADGDWCEECNKAYKRAAKENA